MDINQRIAQFENMVQADPDNDMAHFSLGGAYAQAERWADAANSYLNCVARNQTMSKAYQLGGEALIKSGEKDKAAAVLTEGYKTAAERGDRMPQKAIGELLATIGATIPEVKSAKAPPLSVGSMSDAVTGKAGSKMSRPPFKGPVGFWIFENITKETFDAWIAQGTKVINELRLDLSRDEDSALYDKHMREFLGIDEELYTKLQGNGRRQALNTQRCVEGTMQYYQMWCNLVDSHKDVEFARNVQAYLGHLQGAGKIEGFRVTRRKFGFGPNELGEFNITVWTHDMAQLDQAFNKVAARAGETEQLHRAVYSMVTDFKAGLYRDFPDSERVAP